MNYQNFIKEHKFLLSAIIISLIIAFSSFILFNILYTKTLIEVLRNFIFFIPSFVVFLISLVAYKTFAIHPRITKIFSFLLNTFLIVYFQVVFFFIILFFAELFSEPYPNYADPLKYKEAIKTIKKQDCVKHFPKEIPENAKNVEFNKENNNFFGSEAIALKFDINENYIDKELKKYKFKYIENFNNDNQSGYNSHNPDAMMTDGGRIKTEGFIFYIINDKESDKIMQNYFPYHYGIAVNKKLNQIIYYYTCPD